MSVAKTNAVKNQLESRALNQTPNCDYQWLSQQVWQFDQVALGLWGYIYESRDKITDENSLVVSAGLREDLWSWLLDTDTPDGQQH